METLGENMKMESPDETNFDSMFSGVSLQSILSTQKDDYFYHALGLGLGATTSTTPFPLLPKNEPFYHHYHPDDEFITDSAQPEPELKPQPTFNFFQHLPLLNSLEQSQTQEQTQLLFPSCSKRVRVEEYSVSDTDNNPQTLDSIVQSCVRPVVRPSSSSSSHPVVIPQSKLARQRRQRLSDKTQSLQKLMPWETKMDMATMLEEAHKYVKFLQAQLKALETMPSSSSSSSSLPSSFTSQDCAYENTLWRLTRSQILQVLVNSPVAQTMLYSQGVCVFSVEQVGLLMTKISETKKFMLKEQHHKLPSHPF